MSLQALVYVCVSKHHIALQSLIVTSSLDANGEESKKTDKSQNGSVCTLITFKALNGVLGLGKIHIKQARQDFV